MSASKSENEDLIQRLRTGSNTAAREVFDRYVERLLGLAKRRIGLKMNSRVDPEDVVQSVFRTFFSRMKNDQFQINAEDDLFKLLVRITVHKTLRQIAHHRAAKRDPGQEVGHGSDAHEMLQQAMAAEPTPETVVTFMDHLEHFLRQLPDQDREILELRLQGHSTEEIATKMGSYDRKIRRVLERIRESVVEEQEKIGES
ncbi:MAG: sigma-70 family RNA polymerase sigma factor [Planctomycetes bacterium]|nr:sigma-70 family RNA polymerase sigma factor [Planctomycetota bacterium]